MKMRNLGTNIKVDSCNAEKLWEAYNEFCEHENRLIEFINKYPLEVTFSGYRYVLCGQQELENLMTNMHIRLTDFTEYQNTKWNGHGI